ncbi:hypothetical protein SOMG_00364 [Schizosaccharomyces osmophilus]|uniref:Uncharacterized protein n=1 Tax=Schizosaccharomyces osmophilus TaxID=2545709 RepID=A0AAE9W943_9SCHI|nr:uncharacterized protein SOMG_00364 [Schizosaccharomyces osmophilus]WBW72022.1 hypothetical protein SOMG_00364 [Schizosaccharomyces osmophilus]
MRIARANYAHMNSFVFNGFLRFIILALAIGFGHFQVTKGLFRHVCEAKRIFLYVSVVISSDLLADQVFTFMLFLLLRKRRKSKVIGFPYIYLVQPSYNSFLKPFFG